MLPGLHCLAAYLLLMRVIKRFGKRREILLKYYFQLHLCQRFYNKNVPKYIENVRNEKTCLHLWSAMCQPVRYKWLYVLLYYNLPRHILSSRDTRSLELRQLARDVIRCERRP